MNNDRYIFRFSKVFLLLFALYIPAHSVRIEDRLSRLKNETRFNQIFLRDGLSQSIVQCIAQDKNGVMWFGTEDGLNKYDGYNFTVFRSDSEDPESLSYNNIISLLNDSRGVMWVGTFQSGLNRFDQENQGFVVYRHSPENPNSLSDDNINIIYEDKHGTIWVGTNRGINRLDEPEAGPGDARFSSFVHDPQDTFSLSHDIVRSILEDRAGRLWIGTDDGLNLMVEDSSRQQGVRFIRFQPRSSDRTSLPHPIVRSIYQTKNEEIWIGTDNGLSRVIDKSDGTPSGHFYNYQYQPNNTAGLSSAEVYVILEDQTGLLWIGTNGGGLNVFDRNGEKFISFRNDPEDPSTLSYDQIRAIYEDSSGLIWIGTYGGGIDKVDRRKKLFYHYQNDPQNTNSLNQNIVWSILEDPDNILWIGTNGGGLNKFDRDKNRWWHFLNNPSDSHSLSHNIVRVITRDKKGQYWLGTHGGGVNLFDPRKETFLRI
ncbi:MAG: histidine kinase, partial [Calditrichales bacterium]